jgi:hypothetical protein
VLSTCWVVGSKRVTSCVLALKAYPISWLGTGDADTGLTVIGFVVRVGVDGATGWDLPVPIVDRVSAATLARRERRSIVGPKDGEEGASRPPAHAWGVQCGRTSVLGSGDGG